MPAIQSLLSICLLYFYCDITYKKSQIIIIDILMTFISLISTIISSLVFLISPSPVYLIILIYTISLIIKKYIYNIS